MNNQDFYWKGLYLDNTEFTQSNEEEFNAIRKSDIKDYIMYGDDFELHFYPKEGRFEIITINNGVKDINNIVFKLNDKVIGISDDIISFREKWVDIASFGGSLYAGYYHGFKESNDEFNYIEVLFFINMIEESFNIRIKLNPKIESVLKSTLSITLNDQMEEIMNLDFEEINHKYELPLYKLN